MKLRSVVADFSHADRQTDMTKIFCNFNLHRAT